VTFTRRPSAPGRALDQGRTLSRPCIARQFMRDETCVNRRSRPRPASALDVLASHDYSLTLNLRIAAVWLPAGAAAGQRSSAIGSMVSSGGSAAVLVCCTRDPLVGSAGAAPRDELASSATVRRARRRVASGPTLGRDVVASRARRSGLRGLDRSGSARARL